MLKQRLEAIDHYKYRWGADHTYWVHTALRNSFRFLNKYKVNFAIKGILAYQAWAAYKNYRYVDSMSFMTKTQRASY